MFGLSGFLESGLVQGETGVAGAAQSIFLDQPFGIVALAELAGGSPHVVDGLVDAAMDDLLLEGSEEALGHAVGFGLADEGEARCHTPELDLFLEVIGHEGTAVIVAQREAARDICRDRAEDSLDRQADGLSSGITVADLGDVPSHRFGVPVLDDGEQPDFAVQHRRDLRRVDAPHQVRRVGDDAALMGFTGTRHVAVWREQAVLAHQPQNPLTGDPYAVEHPQSCPYLAMPFANPGRTLQIGADGAQHHRVRDRRLWGSAQKHSPPSAGTLLLPPPGVERRPGNAEALAHAGNAITPARARRDRGGHHRDRRRAKGPACPTRARNTSFSIVSSPTRRIAAASSSLTASPSRSRSAPSIPNRARSRQRSSRYTGTPSSRDRLSAASPRSRRRTTSRLRPTLQRWPGARPPAGTDCPGESVDGLRPTSLSTGPTAAAGDPCKMSVIRLVLPWFLRTIVCPKKPGPAQAPQIVA